FRMMDLFDNGPFDFVMNHEENDLISLEKFVHRTFNGVDLKFFVSSLKNIYLNHGGLESIFTAYGLKNDLQPAIHEFKKIFFEIEHLARTEKHISDPFKNSAAKRINMFLRWMVRDDHSGVDFGIWKNILPSQLSCPLDIHSGTLPENWGYLPVNKTISRRSRNWIIPLENLIRRILLNMILLFLGWEFLKSINIFLTESINNH